MEVYRWKQKGNLYLWRYRDNPKNYPGWQFTGDKEGVNSLCEILSLMLTEEKNVKRTIQLSTPSEVELSISGCTSKAIPEMKVSLHCEVEEPIDWCIKPYADSMDILCSPFSARGLRESLKKWLSGENDFSFGHNANQLWFW